MRRSLVGDTGQNWDRAELGQGRRRTPHFVKDNYPISFNLASFCKICLVPFLPGGVQFLPGGVLFLPGMSHFSLAVSHFSPIKKNKKWPCQRKVLFTSYMPTWFSNVRGGSIWRRTFCPTWNKIIFKYLIILILKYSMLAPNVRRSQKLLAPPPPIWQCEKLMNSV